MTEGNENKERFDSISKDWDKKPRRVLLAEHVFKAMAESGVLSPQRKALEFGCGTGLLTQMMAPGLKNVQAWDVSPKMLDQLTEKIRNENILNVETLEKDIAEQEIQGTFDLVFSSMTLHHIRHTAHLFKKIFESLSSNGILAVADLDKEDGFFHDHVHGVVHHGFDRQALSLLLEEAGFRQISFRTAYKIMKQSSDGVEKPYPVFLLLAEK